jgi:hypothetical protein
MRHQPCDELTISEFLVRNRRSCSKETKGIFDRPVVFFSSLVHNQRTGSPVVIHSRLASEMGWGVNDFGSGGFGADRFSQVGTNQIAACATHVSEVACYEAGYPVDFRVLFVSYPVNYAEIDTLSNDLPVSDSGVIYLVVGNKGTSISADLEVVLHERSNASAVGFVPAKNAGGFRAVNTQCDLEVYTLDKTGRVGLTKKWNDLLNRLVQKESQLQGVNQLVNSIALHMKAHGSLSFKLSESNLSLVPCIQPSEATGMLQLVQCQDILVGSNHKHVRVQNTAVFMPATAHQTAADTCAWLHETCKCIHYGSNTWANLTTLVKQLSHNKSQRSESK